MKCFIIVIIIIQTLLYSSCNDSEFEVTNPDCFIYLEKDDIVFIENLLPKIKQWYDDTNKKPLIVSDVSTFISKDLLDSMEKLYNTIYFDDDDTPDETSYMLNKLSCINNIYHIYLRTSYMLEVFEIIISYNSSYAQIDEKDWSFIAGQIDEAYEFYTSK